MRAIVLCGGFATRMGGLCSHTPKPLLTIGGRPLLSGIMDMLDGLKEVRSILIWGNAKFQGQFSEFIRQGSWRTPVRLDVDPASDGKKSMGCVGALCHILKSRATDDDIIVVNGDNIFNSDIRGAIALLKRSRKPVLTAYDVGNAREAGRTGVMKIGRGSRVIELREKPGKASSTIVSAGIYLYPREKLGMFGQYLSEGGLPDPIGLFHSWLVRRTEVLAYMLDGLWIDIGTPGDYARACREFGR